MTGGARDGAEVGHARDVVEDGVCVEALWISWINQRQRARWCVRRAPWGTASAGGVLQVT